MLLSDDQLHELYEINDDPKRKEFLDDLFSFMQKRGTPINRLPIMAKSVLDLYELYNLVIARGGLVDVINKKLWQEIIKGLHLPSSITSAAFTLRTQYMKYLYPYECEKKNLSTPVELQSAIDGNRREGRRSSYGQFEAMHTQLQMPQMPRSNVNAALQQMSPLALVNHANQQSVAAAAAAHHRLMAPPLGQLPNINTHELELRMMEYLKLFQQKEARRSQSPEMSPREALNALEMSRVALWSMYHNNTSPPASVNASPVEPQREALNLSDSPPNVPMKRERENSEPPHSDRDDFNQQPPMKKSISSSLHDLTLQQIQNCRNQEQQHRNKNRNGDFDDDDEHDDIGNHHRMEHDNDDDDDDDNDDIRMHHSNLVDTTLGKDEGQKHLNGHVNNMRKSPSSSPMKSMHNGHNHHHHHQNDEFAFMSGMQFKIAQKGNGPNGEKQLVVNLELNGFHYEGVLFANPSPHHISPSVSLHIPPTPPTSTSIITASSSSSPTKTTSTATAATPTSNSELLSPPLLLLPPSNNNIVTTTNPINCITSSPSTNALNRSMHSSADEILNGESDDDDDDDDADDNHNHNVNNENMGGTNNHNGIPDSPSKISHDDRGFHGISTSQVN